MSPCLRVLAGPSLTSLVPITDIVNTSTSHKILSDVFEGEVSVHIKDFTDEHGIVRQSDYFSREDRQGITWSIQVCGRFLVSYCADDVLFGNTFDRPLTMPWGSGAALKFMQYIDPTLEHDLLSPTKPWALSPLISTMPHFAHKRIEEGRSSNRDQTSGACLTIKSQNLVGDEYTDELYLASTTIDTPGSSSSSSPLSSSSSLHSDLTNGGSTIIVNSARRLKKRKKQGEAGASSNLRFDNASQRRQYFSTEAHRQAIQFGPEDVISTDFCYGFLEFQPSLSLRLPGGITFDLMRYWDGQPVRFVCCERKDSNSSNEEGWGRVFWCVVIEMV
ncbi:hypothetical protein AMATHDRAFT_62184 [Amanita thiersii Skay4041]|uniref:Domain of unknown function at the cortex 1 domain-containing protein n=1 Tax=Amanita thiersii Skay4041 TaxID=703135 RepID=A0A2A9NKP0_9AGAR|nr:hypothetical protein AMATHDRAFT_62184 [Amanita thiersii Skay4041]